MPGGHPPPPARLAVLAVGAGPGLPLIGGARGQARGLGAPPGAACPATHQACTRGLRPGNWFQRGSCCLRSQEEAVRAPGREWGGEDGRMWRGGGLEFFLSTQGPHLPGGSLSPIPSATPGPGIEETAQSQPAGVGGQGRWAQGARGGPEDKGPVAEPRPGRALCSGGGWGAAGELPRDPDHSPAGTQAPPHHMSLPAPGLSFQPPVPCKVAR